MIKNQVIFIPLHMKDRELPMENDNPLKEFATKYSLRKFNEINIKVLQSCYFEETTLFYKVINQLSFFGIGFNGKLSKYNEVEVDKNNKYFWIDKTNEMIPFNPVLPSDILIQLKKMGIFLNKNLIGVPVYSIEKIDLNFPVKDYLISMGFKIVDLEYFFKVNSSKKSILLNGEIVTIPDSFLNEKLNPHDFEKTKLIISRLNRKGFSYFNDLPYDLDNLLSGFQGVGKMRLLQLKEEMTSLFSSEPALPIKKYEVPILDNNFSNFKFITFKNTYLVVSKEIYDFSILSFGNFTFKTKLSESNIKNLGQIPTKIIELSKCGLSMRAIEKFFNDLIKFLESIYINKDYLQYLKEIEINGVTIKYLTSHELLPLVSLLTYKEINSNIIEKLIDCEIYTIADLEDNDISQLLNKEETYLLQDILGKNLFNELGLENNIKTLYQELSTLNDVTKLKIFTDQEWKIILLKYEFYRSNAKQATLKEISELLNLSRQRINQILNKINNKIKANYKFLYKLKYSINSNGKAGYLNTYFSDFHLLSQFQNYLLNEILNIFHIYFYKTNNILILSTVGKEEFENICSIFEIKAKGLGNKVEEWQFSQLISNEKEETYNPLIKELLVNYVKENSFNKFGLLYYHNELSKKELCLEVLKEYENGIDLYKEIKSFRNKLHATFPMLFESDTDRSIIALCIRDNSKALLWGWGNYIHIDNISVKSSDLTLVKEWLLNKFNKGIFQININAAYKKFRFLCNQLNIPNEHALYSCFRLFYGERFYLPKSPKVFSNNYKENLSNLDLVEKYFNTTVNKNISYEELKSEFVANRGWKEFQLQQVLYNSDFIIRSSQKTYSVVSKYSNINRANLENLALYLKNSFNNETNVVSVRLLFENKKATCYSLGIESEELLYSLLEIYFNDIFYFPRFPHISNVDDEELNSVSNKAMVENFLLAKNCPIYREELREEFISNRGWANTALDNALLSTDILTIEKGSIGLYVHRDLIEWDNSKQMQFEELINRISFEVNKNKDYPIGDISKNILNINELPKLGNGIEWSIELLKTFLEDLSNIRLIGTYKNLFVSIPNTKSINNDYEFIDFILWYKFGGAAKKYDLNSYLLEIGYSYRGEIPKSMLDDSINSTFSIIGDEIVSKKLL
jgi:predicted DNA binding protein